MQIINESLSRKVKLFMLLDVPLMTKSVSRLFSASGDDTGPIFSLSDKSQSTIRGLVRKSHAKPMDLLTVVPWDAGVKKAIFPKSQDQLWVYGTPYWESLTEEQRIEVAWLETARDVSMFIRFEQLIPTLYVGYINQHGTKIDPLVSEYLMIFSREEIVHTLMFRRYMAMAELPTFRPPAAYTKLISVLPKLHPCVGILYTLIIEWTAELAAMHGTQSADVDPLTQQMFKQHHVDESRHIAFARRVVESYFEKAPASDVRQIKRMMSKVIPKFMAEFRFNAEIAEHTSFVFPIQPDDSAAIETVRSSRHYQELDAVRFAPMYAWLRHLGLV